ncbi:OTU domain-containing protein [Sporobolomyces salmoneus]|uniref:OTU domain-containing protein n=1 Tax=Sporobolomyces salmoneus TaxID=183962 RepID=UPI00317EDEE0
MGKTTRRNEPTLPKGRAKTRSDKPKLISDPSLEERTLTQQLRSSGLYAANILGDGNCLFRALSDQLYGTPSQHLQLRKEICGFLKEEKERFRVFIDEDEYKGGWDGYVNEMNQPGTYGTNIELSAFVQLYQRSIKIFQPGLVYVMQPEPSTSSSPSSSSSRPPPPPAASSIDDMGGKMSAREKRAKAREEKSKLSTNPLKAAKGKGKEKALLEPPPPSTDDQEEEELGPLCIVYHSWEHYSSLRNLKGPHTGHPQLRIARPNSPSIVEHLPSNEASPPPPPEVEEEEDVEMSPPPPPPSTSNEKDHDKESESTSLAISRRSSSASKPLKKPSIEITVPSSSTRQRRSTRLSSCLTDQSDSPSNDSTSPRNTASNKRDRSSPLVNLHDLDHDSSRRNQRQYRGDSPALTNSSSGTSTTNRTATTTSSSSSSKSVTTRGGGDDGSATSLELATAKEPNDAQAEEEDEDESGNDSDQDVVTLLRPPSLSKSNTSSSTSTPRDSVPLPPSSSASPDSSRAQSPLPSSTEASSSVSPEKPDSTRAASGKAGGKRDGMMTSRQKKELNRARRMERRKQPTRMKTATPAEEGRTLRSGKRTVLGGGGGGGGKKKSGEDEEGLGGKVRELYI